MFSENLDFISLQQHILISFQTYVFHLKASKYVNFEKCVSKYRTDKHIGGILWQGLLSSCLPSDPCFISSTVYLPACWKWKRWSVSEKIHLLFISGFPRSLPLRSQVLLGKPWCSEAKSIRARSPTFSLGSNNWEHQDLKQLIKSYFIP